MVPNIFDAQMLLYGSPLIHCQHHMAQKSAVAHEHGSSSTVSGNPNLLAMNLVPQLCYNGKQNV